MTTSTTLKNNTDDCQALFQTNEAAAPADLAAERPPIEDMLLYQLYCQQMPLGLVIYRFEQLYDPTTITVVTANSSAKSFLNGVDLREYVGKNIDVVFPGIHESILPASFAEVMRSGQAQDLGEMPYNDASLNGWFAVRAFPLSEQCIGISFENVTERKQAAEALRLSILQEEIIRAQQNALEELTTPLLMINDNIMVMPLIGTIDSRRAQQVMESLLNGVAERHARTAILDITGVRVVDTQVANALLRAAQAVKLLGSMVILTGIRPEVAQTLIGLGIDLSAIVTRSSLQSGIAYALNS